MLGCENNQVEEEAGGQGEEDLAGLEVTFQVQPLLGQDTVPAESY